jgi:hypothetical protein
VDRQDNQISPQTFFIFFIFIFWTIINTYKAKQ